MLGKDLQQAVERPLRPARNNDLVTLSAVIGDMADGGGEYVDAFLALRFDTLRPLHAGARLDIDDLARLAFMLVEGRHADRAVLPQRQHHLFAREIELVRRYGLVGRS